MNVRDNIFKNNNLKKRFTKLDLLVIVIIF